ncbi:MAG: 2'-deoxycytidine 5'-triphosphate deaminase [Hyphomonadaceae bacterium]|nr:2'-deoxycytidine 5'-triphosphate deaminase [Hyphomonadaceae bacterium]
MGILPQQGIRDLLANGYISVDVPVQDDQVQSASLDLRLGTRAFRLRASFLPGNTLPIETCLDQIAMHEIDMRGGAVLETGCIYLVPLMESLDLPKDLYARANPKSSTGRLDVFTRIVCERAEAFDTIPTGYSGTLYAEISPRTFSVLVRPGDRLAQIRFRNGEFMPTVAQTVSIDLSGKADPDGAVGWHGRRHSGLVDLSRIGGHRVLEYWEPLFAPDNMLILDPGEFYILVSRETVQIPHNQAAEMAPIAPEIGEFRAHYAGFFDPGFGMVGAGARAVLEVRGRDVPFILRHGQAVAKLIFENMAGVPDTLYGGSGSHYQSQGLRLSKYFA